MNNVTVTAFIFAKFRAEYNIEKTKLYTGSISLLQKAFFYIERASPKSEYNTLFGDARTTNAKHQMLLFTLKLSNSVGCVSPEI